MLIEEAGENFADYLRLRTEVFVDEQGVPHEREIDEFDSQNIPEITHLVCLDEDEVVGTLRIYCPEKKDTVYLQRITVKKTRRSQGIGAALIRHAERYAAREILPEHKEIRFEIGGQVDKVVFYRQFGYAVYGEPYVDGGLDHRHLAKTVKTDRYKHLVDYEPDYDWLWPEQGAQEIATLRAYVEMPESGAAQKTLDEYVSAVPTDENGVHGLGGWRIDPATSPLDGEAAVAITSGGEDVADGIQDGAESLVEALNGLAATVYWQQLPRPIA